MTLDPSWPVHRATPEVAGHVELLLAGAYEPTPEFLRPLVVDVDEATKKAAASVGHLVLTDDEGAPIADLAVSSAASGDDPHRIAGTVRPHGEPSAQPFARLRFDPAAIRAQLRGARPVAVVLDRPLTIAEEDALGSIAEQRGAPILLLPCTGAAGAGGVPAEITVRSAIASAARLAGTVAVAVATLPLVPVGDGTPPTGSSEAARAVGATLLGGTAERSPLDSEQWAAITSALDAATAEVALPVQPAIAHLLRRWRPPRPNRGLTLFFTGLSGSGKSTIARGVVAAIRERYDRAITLVDGDVARRMLSAGLGFSRADRELNIRRIGWVAAEITRHSGLAVCAPIAPYAATRAEVRRMVEANGHFVLVHVATPLEVCELRDRKGLYAKARAGIITEFTGISDPYEEPDDADLRIDTSEITIEHAVAAVLEHLEQRGWLLRPT